MRNATIPIACACVMDTTLVRLEALVQHFVEKRSKRTKKEKSRKLKPVKRHPSLNLDWIFAQKMKQIKKIIECTVVTSGSTPRLVAPPKGQKF